MNDLFSGAAGADEAPLADRMRPRTLDDIAGQDHIVGPGRLLRRAIQADRLSSLIFYGPPGTGKTSLARVIANTTKAWFESLNAVLSGIKDIRDAIDRASERRKLYARRTILFVDEVHRWNKAQQDALLPWVENGTVILVGATTENPFFEVNRALVSRSRIFQLKPLEKEDLMLTAQRALNDVERGYGKRRVIFEDGTLEHLVEVAGGDARSLLNALELAVESTPPDGVDGAVHVTLEAAEESIQRRAVLYDKDGDYHFDTISAFIKSLRGSDPDAALYWLAKMLRAGEDPAFIFRRMIILASEDVGLADPQALGVVISCAAAFERIGFPEGNYPLAEACLYLATAPKSNSAMAFFDALELVEKENAEVPSHLRDPVRDKEGFGHGKGYIYPHTYREHWCAQQYLPSALQGKFFYTPSFIGYEKTIRDEVLRKRELQAAALLGESALSGDGGYLSWSPGGKAVNEWVRRLETGRSRLLLSCRDAIMEEAAPGRHERLLVLKADDGLLVWEGLRRAPEGLSAACVTSEDARETLLRFAASAAFDETELPRIAVRAGVPPPGEAEACFGCAAFDCVLAREPWRGSKVSVASIGDFAVSAARLLALNGRLVFLASPPVMGERLSRIVEAEATAGLLRAEAALISAFKKAEDEFFSTPADSGGTESLLWDEETLKAGFSGAGFELKISIFDQKEERLISERDISAWFNREKSSWGGAIHASLGEKGFETLKNLLRGRSKQGAVLWKWKGLLCRGVKRAQHPAAPPARPVTDTL
ncbi:MAG: AAA family ATPase [Spirochaetaceae bacterium]|jgi:putative ATPase|nr:AAA family ATPase [Spirochaetaceae bacterium]